MSGGTKASLAGVIDAPSFAMARRRPAHRARRRALPHVPAAREGPPAACRSGSSEHFALPRFHPGLREVNAYLGWFGPVSRPMQASSLVGSLAFKLPGVESVSGAATDRFVKGSTGGPDAERARAQRVPHRR